MEIDTARSTPPTAPAETDQNFEEMLFRVPPRIQEDQHYLTIHAEFIRRLRQDAHGLEMTTLQYALIERIATGYVIIRWHEDNPGNWVGVNTEKDFRLEWRALFSEFNKILASGEDKRRDALRLAYQDIVLKGLDFIPDPEVRKAVRTFYMDQFSALGD